jgi:hypothetical protein
MDKQQEALAQPTLPVQPVQEPPSEWALIKNILDEHGLQAISFVADWKAAQPVQECPNLEDCKGLCFQCEYFNAETGMTEYPAPLPAQPPLPVPEPVASEYIGLPVAYQYAYPDGTWRFSFGDEINGCKPIASRAVYARKDGK